MFTHSRSFGLIFLASISLCGCGSQGPTCIPVSGQVTLDGEKPPGPGYLYFTIDGTGVKGISRPGTADFDARGSYKVMSFEPGDGLMPGKYLIRVDCWKSPPNLEGNPVVSHLPQRYQDASRSGLELNIEPNSKPVTFDIRLTSK